MKKYLVVLLASISLVGCKSIQESYPNKEVRKLEDMQEGMPYVLEETAVRKSGDFVKFDFQVRDAENVLYALESTDDFVTKVEIYKDGEWVELKKEDVEIANSDIVNCLPKDYCILLDQSGSMAKERTAIFRQADKFIDYKNDYDHVALIKYTRSPLIACGYFADKGTLVKELFNYQDELIGAGTNTANAYQAYLDSLKSAHPNKEHDVIIFSDITGVNTHELQSLIKTNFEDSVSTHQIIYTHGLFNAWYIKRHKEEVDKLFNGGYGEVYQVDEFSQVSKYLNTIIDENCLSNTINLPLYIQGENRYRVTSKAGGQNNQVELSYTVEPPPVIEDDSFDFHFDEANLLDIHFDTGSDSLLPESHVEIDKVFQFLDANPSIHIELQGHTDNQGGFAYNQKLSQERADAVRNRLIELGIVADRIEAKGYAYLKPIASNKTVEGRRENRRTAFIILR